MAETGGGGNGGDKGEDPTRVGGDESERYQIDDRPTSEAPTSTSVEVSGGDSGNGSHAVEVDGDGDRRASVGMGRTPVLVGSEGPRVSRLDSRSGVEALVVTGGGLGGASGSSSSSGVGGEGQPGLSPSDSERGKGPMVEEEVPRVVHAERVEFIPHEGSSGHEPITSSDFAEFVGDASLARLMRECPAAVAAVIAAREERLQEIALAEEAERLRREQEAAERAQKELERETEAAERAQEEAVWVQESAVALAESRLKAARVAFVAESYVLPEPHLFIPSGIDSYVPRQEHYDDELVLRDPTVHLSTSWTDVFPFDLL